MGFSLNAVTIDSGCEYVWLMLREWIVPSVRILDDSLMIALGRIVDVHSIEPVGKRRESVVETIDELFSTLGCDRPRLDGSTIPYSIGGSTALWRRPTRTPGSRFRCP